MSVEDEARAKLEGITPGPWIAECSREQGNCVIPADAQSTREAVAVTRLYHQHADAAFIAWCREGVPALLAELETSRAEVSMLRDAVDTQFHVDRRIISNLSGYSKFQTVRLDAAFAAIQQVRELHNSDGVRWLSFPREAKQDKYCTYCQETAPCRTVELLERRR